MDVAPTRHQMMRAMLAAALLCAASATAAPLPQLNIDRAQTTVSGMSSGGYMAVQLHVAYSSRFAAGAAVMAGGPFNCAEGSLINGLLRCLGKTDIPVAHLVSLTNQWAKEGFIDPTVNLAKSKVYLFAAANDSVVKEATTTALKAYYLNYIPAANIALRTDVKGEHGFITDDYGNGCMTKEKPFIINCNFDLTGALLGQLYGTLNARRVGALEGSLVEFDQTPTNGMGSSGWAYVPKNCAGGASCRVHVALHGCKTNVSDVGQEFVKNAGYNRWADTNNMVVLYPQTGKGATNSCWDWWGYDDANYAKKSAPQMKAIVAMLDRLSAPTSASAAAPPAGK